MHKFLVLLALVSAASAQGDLASVISSIFGNSTDPAVSETSGRVPLPTAAPPASGPSTIVPPFVNTTPGSTEPEPCVNDGGEPGECVRYFLCNNNNTIIDDGTGLIDIRVRDGPCASYLDVCCLSSARRPITDPIIQKPDPNTEVRPQNDIKPPKTDPITHKPESNTKVRPQNDKKPTKPDIVRKPDPNTGVRPQNSKNPVKTDPIVQKDPNTEVRPNNDNKQYNWKFIIRDFILLKKISLITIIQEEILPQQ